MPNKSKSLVQKTGDRQVTTAAAEKANTILRPSAQAAITVQEYSKTFGELDIKELLNTLTNQIESVQQGKMHRGEEMLAAQAYVLDAIFHCLARRAINASKDEHLERNLRLALKAQGQARATWETVAMIKHPPIAGYVNQANIAHGPQQVNYGPPIVHTRVRKNKKRPNKLLEKDDDKRLDTSTTGQTGRVDHEMATLGEIDGTKDSARQNAGLKER